MPDGPNQALVERSSPANMATPSTDRDVGAQFPTSRDFEPLIEVLQKEHTILGGVGTGRPATPACVSLLQVEQAGKIEAGVLWFPCMIS